MAAKNPDIIDTTTIPGYTILTFSTVGTGAWTAPADANLEVLVVAGGGGGGSGYGAGGGAGGVVYDEVHAVTSGGVYTVTVGDGGAGDTTDMGTADNGGDSVFNTLTAVGGGGGGSGNGTDPGEDGGSGGGSPYKVPTGGASTQTASGGDTGHGHAGGGGIEGSGYGAGGGGGAGAVGTTAAGSTVGDGGIGVEFDITGTGVYYAGGGGSGNTAQTSDTGVGGQGGGGDGGDDAAGEDGIDGLGGGGGGGGYRSGMHNGGAGGSGVVIIKYAGPVFVALTPLEGSILLSADVGFIPAVIADPFTITGALSAGVRLIQRAPVSGILTIANGFKVGASFAAVNSLNVQLSSNLDLQLTILRNFESTFGIKMTIEELAKFNNTLDLRNHIFDADSGVTQGDYYFLKSHGL